MVTLKCGMCSHESATVFATAARSRDMVRTSSTSRGPAEGAGSLRDCDGAAAPSPPAAPSRSCKRMRPSGPLPRTWARSIPSSRARLRTTGAARSRPAAEGVNSGASLPGAGALVWMYSVDPAAAFSGCS